jgi:hypothetical protein
LLVLGALLISPWWGLVGAVVGVLAAVAERLVVPRLGHSDRPRRGSGIDVVAWFGVVLAAIVAVLVVWINRADRPLPNSGWTESFDHLHGAALLAVLCVTVGAFAPPGRRRREGGA